MEITVTYSTLSAQLHAQRSRVLAKKTEAEAFLTAHTREHEEEEAAREAAARDDGVLDSPLETRRKAQRRKASNCPAVLMTKGLILGLDNHVRRLDALLDVLQTDPAKEVTLSLAKYLNAFVSGPYDGVTLPDPEVAHDDAPTAMSLPFKLPN